MKLFETDSQPAVVKIHMSFSYVQQHETIYKYQEQNYYARLTNSIIIKQNENTDVLNMQMHCANILIIQKWNDGNT